MKKKLIAGVMALCLMLSPLTSFAKGETPNPNAHAPETAYSDSLYENGEIASEAKVTFEYNKNEQKKPSFYPRIGCAAAFLADPVSSKIFYEKDAYEKRYPASTTKILTALLVLENCKTDEMVKVSQEDIDAVPSGYSTANLQAGEELSVYTMLQALLIPSANEAANSLARHVSGSIEAFSDLSNKRAKELGCETLHFVNPNGVHDKNHYCSAYDLYLIARECQKYDVFNEIVKTKSFTVPATDIYKKEDRTYSNTNALLLPSSEHYYDACTGIKTGHTSPAGECLVSSSYKNNLNLICVVLGGKIAPNGINERFYDSKKLFEYAYNNYEYKQIADKSKTIEKLEVENAKDDSVILNAVIQTDISAVAPNDLTQYNVVTKIKMAPEIKAPIKKGQVLGTITYKVDGLNYTTNIVAESDVAKKPFWLYNLLFVLGFIILLIAAYIIFNKVVKKKRKANRKKSRENDEDKNEDE